MSYVLAADPGKMTGFAIWAAREGKQDNYVASAQYDFDEGLGVIEEFLEQHIGEVGIVAERYIISGQTLKKTRQSWSLEVIGVLRWFATKYENDFELQPAADAKAFAPDTRLKQLGWHRPGKVHANDASRHLLLYLCKKKIWVPELLTADLPGKI